MIFTNSRQSKVIKWRISTLFSAHKSSNTSARLSFLSSCWIILCFVFAVYRMRVENGDTRVTGAMSAHPCPLAVSPLPYPPVWRWQWGRLERKITPRLTSPSWPWPFLGVREWRRQRSKSLVWSHHPPPRPHDASEYQLPLEEMIGQK